MISIIICSRSNTDLAAVSDNIAATIGVPYEIIGIDNSKGDYGICEAYNKGASQAQYNHLCFMHEDIVLHTKDWGALVVSILKDPSIGVLGVTGGRYQLAVPSVWWVNGPDFNCDNVLNIFKDGRKEMRFNNPLQQELTDAAVVDGLWMCSRREVWQQHPFDAKTFSNFHLYDLDYCAELYANKYRVCVTYAILLEHHSQGSLNDAWLYNSLKYQEKRKAQLPFGPATVSPSLLRKLNINALHKFTYLLLKSELPKKTIRSYVVKCLFASPFSKNSLYMAKEYVKKYAKLAA